MCSVASVRTAECVERVPRRDVWIWSAGRADFGNFQDAEGKQKEKAERLRFGRFFYRFPNGESGADVYDRMTIFEDHLIRHALLQGDGARHAKDLAAVQHGVKEHVGAQLAEARPPPGPGRCRGCRALSGAQQMQIVMPAAALPAC